MTVVKQSLALERAEITQLSNSSHVIIFTVPALERAEITQLSNYLHILIAHIFALERAEITQLSNHPCYSSLN